MAGFQKQIPTLFSVLFKTLKLSIFVIILHLIIVIFQWCKNKFNPPPKPSPVITYKKPIIPKELYKQLHPPIAIFTIVLATINLFLWICVHLLYHFNYLPYKICLILWIINVYVAWTPMHEATHNAIATNKSGYYFLNGLIGRICSFIMAGSFPLFRLVHLKHHKYTNIPSHDPDYFSISGLWFILPIKWYLQIYKYLYIYLSEINKQPIFDIIEFMFYAIIPDYIEQIFGIKLFFIWLLPSWIGTTILAFVFNYIPHRGHIVGHTIENNNEFIGTNVTSFYGNIKVLTIPLMYQNYHNIHHLYPWIPFYKYSDVWNKLKNVLLQKGTKIRSLLPIFE